MRDKTNLLVYPYDIEFTPILRHKWLLDGYEIKALVSPSGWGLDGSDAGEADHGSNTGITVTSDFNGMLEHCDAVMFVDTYLKSDFDSIIYPKFEMAINAGKNIVCLIELDGSKKKCIEKKCKENSLEFKYCRIKDSFNFEESNRIMVLLDGEDERITEIVVPVIFVAGLMERMQKFEIQLFLREYLINRGYKISQIGSRQYCEILGFHSFPDFMFCNTLPETKKILLFNRFVKGIEQNENPDVIIIGIPGGTGIYDKTVTNKFGIIAYEVSSALTPDASVLSIPYGNLTPESLQILRLSAKFKFGFEPDCYNIVNARIDSQDSKILNKVMLNWFDAKAIKGLLNYNVLGNGIFNILCDEDGNSMANFIVDKLSAHSEIEYIK